MKGRRVRWWAAVLIYWLPTLANSLAWGQGADDDEAEVPGLLATFRASAGSAEPVRRVVADFQGQWSVGAPDPRVPSDNFVGRWEGLLLIQNPGKHAFWARTDGAVTLTVAGRVVLDGKTEGEAHSASVDLPSGFSLILVEYRHKAGEAHLAIDWEGPSFAREPLPARLLFHDSARKGPVDRFEEGRRLADRLGCANCHTLLDLPRHPHLGPALGDVTHALDPTWLQRWLSDPSALRSGTRMPRFGAGFSAEEAADIAAFLARGKPKAAPVRAEIQMALNVADPEQGRLLFGSLGCLGCHTRGGPSTDAPGPDLSHVDLAWTRAGIATYLEHPRGAKTVSLHRPDLRVTADEAAHLAAALIPDPTPPAANQTPARGDAAKGRKLAESARCIACHAVPDLAKPSSAVALTAGSHADAGCLADAPAGPFVPHFALTAEQRGALREFVGKLPRTPSPTPSRTLAEDTIRRLNCYGCHSRDGQGGHMLGDQVAALLAAEPKLGAFKGTLTPPNLTGVGDKLRPEYLGLSVRGTAPTARPWLSVRMPVFPFENGEADAVVESLQSHDRMQSQPDPSPAHTQLATAAKEEAAQLIGQRGFGCVSCHVLAGRIPPGGEPETLGPDLALAHRRMTERYFRRWIANPQRIIPGTPMPQFLKPVESRRGSLDEQLDTIWKLVGSPGIAEVAASGTREVLKRQGDRALVVRDMVLLPEAPDTQFTPRALAIGLKNDLSLLFDGDRLTWLAWWRGGFLSRTKSGRLWEWHPEGERIWTAANRRAPVMFVGPQNQVVPPQEIRERFGALTTVDFEGSNLAFEYELNGPAESKVRVREQLHPLPDGWERAVEVSNVPEGYRPVLAERPPNDTWTWSAGKSKYVLIPPPGSVETFRLADDPQARLIRMETAKQTPPTFQATMKLRIDAPR